MFGRLFGKKEKLVGAEQMLCMPLIRSGKGLTEKEIQRAWMELWPNDAMKLDVLVKDNIQLFTLEMEDMVVHLAPMKSKVPGEEVEEAAQRSMLWLSKRKGSVPQYSMHLMAMGFKREGVKATSEQLAAGLTRAVAAIILCGDVEGVYWGSAGMVVPSETFLDYARGMEEDLYPVPLWVAVALSEAVRGGGGYSVSTWGMEAFGHKNFEIDASQRSPGDLMGLMYDMMNYVLVRGPILKHGNTFGDTDDERLRVVHGKSRLGSDREVIRLEVP